MASIPCNIVLLPELRLAQAASGASADLAVHGGLFTLDNVKYYAHVSLYMTQLDTFDIDKIAALLKTIADDTAVLTLNAKRYDQTMGFVDAEYARTTALERLQIRVVQAVNPLRDGMREKDRRRMLAATGLARRNFEQYGYGSIGTLFRPHLTLTRFDSADGVDNMVLPALRTFSGRFTRLGLYEMGDNGTCIREIFTADLR